MKRILLFVTLLASSFAYSAHQHGLLNIDIAIDNNQANSFLEAPLDDLYIYKRENRKELVDQAIIKMQKVFEDNISKIFNNCKIKSNILTSKKKRYSRRHVNLKLDAQIECPSKIKLSETGCFDFSSFNRIKRIKLSLINNENSIQRSIELKKSCPHVKFN